MKKRGFTLIELLAVIVILAIIALIATPIIMNVIENTKEASYDRSVENILHSANIFAMEMKVTENLELDKNIYDKVVEQIQGDRPDTGQAYVNKNGEIALSLRYGDYCYTKSYGEKSYYKEKTEDNCITPFYYLKKAANSDEDINFLDGPLKKSQISKIVTVASNIVPEDALGSWDVGVDKDGNAVSDKVMAWYKESSQKDENNNQLYEVYIGQEGGIKANPNSNSLFSYLPNLTEIDISNFDTSNVTTMSALFLSSSKLTLLDLSSFDTQNVTHMNEMFWNCQSLEKINLSSFDTSKVQGMANMFRECYNLTDLDLSNFNTSNLINMGNMFYGCKNLTNLDISNFDTSNVTTMSLLFASCKSLTKLDLSNFNTSNVIDMSHMFNSCTNLTELNLSNFDTSNVTKMNYMFYGSQNLTEIIVGENWKEADNNTDMFKGCGTDHVTVKE